MIHSSSVISKTAKIGKALEEWVVNKESVKDKGINLLMEMVKVNRAERGDLKKWADKMDVTVGCAEEPRKKRSKKS